MALSRSRFDELYSSMTATAKKVYEIVPIQEAWTIARIIGEMQRVGIGMDFRVIHGSLVALMKHNMVIEPARGEFKRAPIRENITKPLKEDEPAMATATLKITPKQPAGTLVPPPSPAAKPTSPLDILAVLAERAVALSKQANDLASDISDAAVDIQAQIEANEENVAKLKQLGMLLKSLDIAA